MLYGKLICGYLVSTNKQEGKPVVFSGHEDAPQGYEYIAGWEDQGETIGQTWTLVERPDPTPEEALSILLGGAV